MWHTMPMKRSFLNGVAVALLLSLALSAQSRPPARPATDVTAAEIEGVLKYVGKEGGGIDRQIRVVDVGGTTVGVGILRRGATKPGTAVPGLSHTQVTEVYYVVSGSGTLVTGGTISDARPSPPEGDVVKILVGPTLGGTIAGGERRPVSAGDVVIIPAGTPHGFSEIKDQVTYLSVRVDPDRVLPVNYLHPALRK